MTLTKTKIDRLGERLKGDTPQEADLILLDAFRLSFGPAYENVARMIRNQLTLEVTGRPAKTTKSVIEKLRRETTRLSQIQDIAGCRLVVPGVPEQDRIVEALSRLLPKAVVVDRRKTPSYGYRGVHVVPRVDGYSVEIQVRTELQHRWAQISEKLADVVDPSIKYGGGPAEITAVLKALSRLIAEFEETEYDVHRMKTGDTVERLGMLEDRLETQRSSLLDGCQDVVDWFTRRELGK